ncbi:DUF7344 domain-containing protein [Natrinema salinisoli]|uniref:DUF7344 domain-containing protein n=1 Tax=Natrinema salinisoli TaxID=2878535 RepID=UPI001CF08FE9|nr:hypothetical protein [Natrinema salinisoli]
MISGNNTIVPDDGTAIDDIFDALADRHRRRLLIELLDGDRRYVSKLTGVSRDLAEADEELLRKCLSNEGLVSQADEELLLKHQIHLPKLAEYGFVEWDRDEHVVTRGPRFDDVRPVLEFLEGQQNEQHLEEIEISPR